LAAKLAILRFEGLRNTFRRLSTWHHLFIVEALCFPYCSKSSIQLHPSNRLISIEPREESMKTWTFSISVRVFAVGDQESQQSSSSANLKNCERRPAFHR